MTDPRWRAFVALMDRAGWRLAIQFGAFVHKTGAGYHIDGHYIANGARKWRRDSVPTWDQYLEAGTTPPPF